MEQKLNARRGILAVLAVVLLAAAVLTFPYAFGLTWSLPGSDTDRTLTYTVGSLTWDSAADIDENGVIVLSVFRPEYASVSAQNGDKVVAPGTEKSTGIRLLNSSAGSVSYTAALYRLDAETVPVTAALSGADTVGSYALPNGVSAEQVVGAVGGTLGAGGSDTLSVDWLWQFTVDDETDRSDTELGNDADPDEVEYGVYIVVTDTNTGDSSTPRTGDSSHTAVWFIMAVVSLCAVIFFLFWGERSKKTREEDEG